MIEDFRGHAQRAILADPAFADFANHVGALCTQQDEARLPALQ